MLGEVCKTYPNFKVIATTLRLEGGMGKEPLFLKNNRLGRWLLQQAVTYLLKQ